MLSSIHVRIAAALVAMAIVTWAAYAAGSPIIALGGALVAATALTVLLSGSILKPISRTTEVARRIARGNLNERLTPRPSGEMGDLAEAFNEMAQSLDQLVADASADHTRMLAALNSSADAVIGRSRPLYPLGGCLTSRLTLQKLHLPS